LFIWRIWKRKKIEHLRKRFLILRLVGAAFSLLNASVAKGLQLVDTSNIDAQILLLDFTLTALIIAMAVTVLR
jgi:hypothetical protein